jgi:hypothetical protein
MTRAFRFFIGYSPYFTQYPDPKTTTPEEALAWGDHCNKRYVAYIGDWASLALSQQSHQFYTQASLSSNLAVSGKAHFHLWQIESEGRAPQSSNKVQENRQRSLMHLQLSAKQGYAPAQALLVAEKRHCDEFIPSTCYVRP